MLKLVDIKKTYTAGNTKVDALKGINLEFRQAEFVAILGASGCGKTTMLNIIGGLDQYTSGDLIIDDVSTKNYKDKDWDAYRNNCVGFIFQSYNLIHHINVLTNVEMSMTLSGYSHKERKEKALKALERVGLLDQAYKKPNQLSGGQMQRVAIARALVNDPQIILADEPTGALDSHTSVQIMDLIQEIAAEKLVIMVTHNPQLAQDYANRIVEIKDGEIISDTRPLHASETKTRSVNIKKTAMSYASALHLSFNNIRKKKGRTLLTAFASSIGIIGIALILSLSNGFQNQIDIFEQDSLSQMPITISEQTMQMDTETLAQYEGDTNTTYFDKYSDVKEITPLKDQQEAMTHENKITKNYIDYIEAIDPALVGGVMYAKGTGINAIVQNDDQSYAKADNYNSVSGWSVLPDTKDANATNAITNNFDILAGTIDNTTPGLILTVDSQNRVNEKVLATLGISDTENISFDEIMKKEVKIVSNDAFYEDKGQFFIQSQDYESLYNDAPLTIKVQAIIRGKPEKEMITSGSGMNINSALVDEIISMNKDSKIVTLQQSVDYNVLSGKPFDTSANSQNTKDSILANLGAESQPMAIYIYPQDFDSKDEILSYLDAYNDGLSKEDSIQYQDMAEMISGLTGNIMGAITLVLIAFSAISLIVSSIMIGIITYISVLERTKEIGVLRALGARKRDISRVFNAETMIVGLCSGLLGIGIAMLLTIPVNSIILEMSGLGNVASLSPIHALILILVSMTLTMIGGFIPAKMASKKDPVNALRSE